MMFIGVDPGQKGAIAIIPPTSTRYVQVHKTPFDKDGFDGSQVLDYIDYIINDPAYGVFPATVYVERQWSRPKQNVKSMDVLMQNYGEWLGFFKALRIPVRTVAARTWKKKVLGDANATKEQTIQFVNDNYLIKLETNQDGEGDAIAIAHYAKLVYNES